MMNTKVIAMYLPQYHSIPENDLFWGEGFTDWVTVQKAKPLYENHVQPRIPADSYYYNLSLKNDVLKQANLAKEYGIFGFGIYHYWFNNDKNLLTKPAEIIKDNKEIDINYFFAWDNISWKRSWSNIKGNDWAPLVDDVNVSNIKKQNGPAILIPHILGKESDWENHFNYLVTFFNDKRYIKINNKPVFVIYHYNDEILKMAHYWNKLAILHGFDGMYILYRADKVVRIPEEENVFTYEPAYSAWGGIAERIIAKIEKYLKINPRLKKYDYDKVWKTILSNTENNKNPNHWPGAFVSYDDTPRRGINGKVIVNDSPIKFQEYMENILKLAQKQGKPFVLLTAWNEWGEGAYLEPDTINGNGYLKALKNAINNCVEK